MVYVVAGSTGTGRGVPGVVRLAGYLEGAIPGTEPGSRIQAYLMNLEVYSVHTAVWLRIYLNYTKI